MRTDPDAETQSIQDLNRSLTGRYRVDRVIGRGGMATVYLALDERHARNVALKVLDPDVGASIGTDRFLAEIRVTAKLQHPNVLPLFDSGEADGRLFYVTPFVAGESLRRRLEREGQLAIDESVRLVSAIAHALDHAHRAGVVHRDVKPENILLSDGMPIVADFGIAKALAGSQRATAAMTQVGMSLGTPSYMSPEQAMGEADVDGRSDTYALGCLLYEMLAGALPFTGPTAHAIIAHHLMTPVPSIRSAREAVPPVIDTAIARAMAKDPAARFGTPGDFAAALVAAPTVEPKPDYSLVAEAVTRTAAPIVGRKKEVADLFARLDAAEGGRGGLVLIGGEPGVGKTRLTEAVLLEARRRGFYCAVGHCYEMEGAAPYLPFVEHLEFATRVVPPGRLRAVLGGGAAEIARIMPAFRQLFPDIPPPLDLPADQQRQYLFTSIREYLERSAANVPLVFLFDDLHWADESSLLLLEHIAQRLPHLRILALGTYRDVDLEVGRPFARSLERLMRQRLADRLLLRRMPQEDVADMLAALGAPGPPPSLVEAVYRETEGNPFFVEEVFHHLREEGRLLDAAGRWLPDLEIDTLEVPEGVRLVIGRRLDRVGDACRAVLTSAAIVGPRFDLRVLEALGESDPEAILDALERAEAAGLILSQPVGRETRYTFAHELIRQTLIGALSMPRRQRRHQKIAEAIEKAFAGKLETKTADLAYHLFQAGAAVETGRALHYLTLAAREALAAGAFDEAHAHVERAMSTLESAGDRAHADLLALKGEALRGAGKWAAAVAAFEQAADILAGIGQWDAMIPVAIAIADVQSWAARDHRGLSELLERTIARVPHAPAATRARLLARGAVAAMYADAGYEKCLARIEQGLELARESGDEKLSAEIIGLRGSAHHNFLRLREATGDLGAAYEAAVASGARWDAARWGGLYVHDLMLCGQFDRALAVGADVERIGAEIGHIAAVQLAENAAGGIAWMRHGDLSRLDTWARDAGERWVWPPLFREFGQSLLAMSRLMQELPDAAGPLNGSAERAGHEAWRDWLWGDLFLVLAHTDPAHALAELGASQARLPVPGRIPFAGTRLAMCRVVEGVAEMGDLARAASYYDECAAVVGDGAAADFVQVFDCVAGIAAAAGRRWDAAQRHFDAALRIAGELPHLPAQAEVRRWNAWMLSMRNGPGDRDLARTLLAEALAINERLRLPGRARLCSALLGS